MQDDKYTEVFLRLQSNYILLFIHDIMDYAIPELSKLADQLEKQQKLAPSQEEINLELIKKSEGNVKEKKRKKK
jgi:hypothetical protein